MPRTKTFENILNGLQTEAKRRKYIYIGTALAQIDIDTETWEEWKTEYANNPEVLKKMRLIEFTFQSNLFENALTGKGNSTVTIFALKTMHNLSDKKETPAKDNTSTQIEIPYIYVEEGYTIDL